MRHFIVFEPRTGHATTSEHVEFAGVDILAVDARAAASTYVEQRPHKWDSSLCLWVVDRMLHPSVGPNTYQLRATMLGGIIFW